MISLYTSYFAPARIVQTRYIKPIQVGRAGSKHKLPMPGDDTGANISDRNSEYCELTAVYWAWKNDLNSDYIGSFHYRRFFDFQKGIDRPRDAGGTIIAESLDGDFLVQYGLTDNSIENLVTQYDAIIPEVFDVSSVSCSSVRMHYKLAPHHFVKDFDLAGEVISKISPSYSKYFNKMATGRSLYANNMFIFNRDIFDRYCSWLFPILFEIEKLIDITKYTTQEKRMIGYIAERLFTVFALRLLDDSSVRVSTLPRVLVQDTTLLPEPPAVPLSTQSVVSVVASADSAYLPHLGALIASVFTNACHNRHIDFVVLDGGLKSEDRKALRELETLHPSASISFMDLSRAFLSIKTHTYFTRGTFFRLAMPSLLWNRDRVVFLDTDMVVLGDVAQLFDTELNGNLVAAVSDLAMRAFVAMEVRSIAETGGIVAGQYLEKTLEMGAAANDYFQAGTMLFDLKAFRNSGIESRITSDLKSNTYWFLDQDALNKHLVGKVEFLDNRWNSLYFDEHHQKFLNPEDQQRYILSNDNPLVVHFAGTLKPWLSNQHPGIRHYWRYLRLTAWYEQVLAGYVHHHPVMANSATIHKGPGAARQVAQLVWHAMPKWFKLKVWPFATWLSKTLS